MKRFIAVILCACILLGLTACGGQTGNSADTNKLVIWHDKEDAVIAALEDYLSQAVPNLDCLLYTYKSPRDRQKSRMPSSA